MRFLPYLAIAAILVLGFLAGANRYIYMTAQHAAYRLGFNLNNIASDNYVAFINSQDTTAKSTNPIGKMTLGVNDNKYIEIDLSEQRLYMKEGSSTVNSFLVSTGKWAPTPKGEWRVWTKLRSTTMTGGSK